MMYLYVCKCLKFTACMCVLCTWEYMCLYVCTNIFAHIQLRSTDASSYIYDLRVLNPLPICMFYVCTYTCMCLYVCGCLWIHSLYACVVYVCIHVCVFTFERICVHIYNCDALRRVRMDLSDLNQLPARMNYILMYVHIYIYRCLEIWFVCISYVCKCMCAYIDVYIHVN